MTLTAQQVEQEEPLSGFYLPQSALAGYCRALKSLIARGRAFNGLSRPRG